MNKITISNLIGAVVIVVMGICSVLNPSQLSMYAIISLFIAVICLAYWVKCMYESRRNDKVYKEALIADLLKVAMDHNNDATIGLLLSRAGSWDQKLEDYYTQRTKGKNIVEEWNKIINADATGYMRSHFRYKVYERKTQYLFPDYVNTITADAMQLATGRYFVAESLAEWVPTEMRKIYVDNLEKEIDSALSSETNEQRRVNLLNEKNLFRTILGVALIK